MAPAMTPWRRLPVAGRWWFAAAIVNTVVFLIMPSTAATSPWRPIVGGVVATSAAASLVLVVIGLVLRQRHASTGEAGGTWSGALILAALPGAFYAFFWVIGPLY